jgi:hypothetical protein
MTPSDLSQARQYLAKVLAWPQEGDPPAFVGIHWTFMPKDGLRPGQDKLPWAGRAVRTLKEAMNALEWATGNADTRDIYLALGTQRTAEEKLSGKGRKYYAPIRNHANVGLLKSLFVDIDAKGADKGGYDTIPDAVTALGNFLRASGMPKPSMTVATGGGLHVYWTLDRALMPHEWGPLAYALAEATKRHGLRCDTQCTIDSARVLRIPDTFNHKTGTPRPVRIAGTPTDFDYSVEKLAQILEPYKVAIKQVGRMLENPELFKPQLPVVEDELSAGIESNKAPPVGLKQVALECAFIRDAVLTGGKDYTNPLWNLTTLIATFTKEGKRGANIMAKGHPGYTQESTDELYDRKARERDEKNLGWPSCQTISGSGCKACQTCPHFSKGKSPLNHARKDALPAPPALVAAITPAGGATTTFDDMPAGYTRNADGIVFRHVLMEDGTTNMVPVNSRPMLHPRLNKNPAELHFTTLAFDHDKPHGVKIALSAIGSQEMRKVLQDQFITVFDREIKPMTEFLLSWVDKLRASKDAVLSSTPYGWSINGPKIEGFSYGGSIWTPDGPKIAPAASPVTTMHYRPVGELAPWVDAAKMVTSQGRPGIDAVIAAAFGGPLVRATGQQGLLLSIYSMESGIGKTTALRIAQAVWGNPIAGMQGLNDTQNATFDKMGQLNSIPMFWDEIKTKEEARNFTANLFHLTGGKGKARLSSNIQQRQVGTWNTLLVSASNESLVDHIIHGTRMTTAGIYRIFEFEVPPATRGQIPIVEASRNVSRLSENFGNAGLVYAQFLGENLDHVDKEVAQTMIDLQTELGIAQDERFWAALITVLLCGARFANDLGLTTIDVAGLKAHLIDKLTSMRELRDAQPVDMSKSVNVSAILAHFLGDKRRRHTLMTNMFWLQRGKPQKSAIRIISDVSQLDSIHVHVSQLEKKIRISSKALEEWLEAKEYSRTLFLRAMKDRFGMVDIRARIGAGTDLAGPKEYLHEIDLTVASEVNFLDET